MGKVLHQDDKRMEEEVKRNLITYFEKQKTTIEEKHTRTTFPHYKCNSEKQKYELNLDLLDCKVLIVTANSVERSVVTHCLTENSINKSDKIICYVSDCFNYQIATLDINKVPVKVAHIHAANMSSGTDGGSQDAVDRALKRFTPNLVVSLGCAYGWDPSHNDGQKLGDVLLSKELIAYSEKNKRTDKELIIKDDVIHPISTTLKPFLQFYEEEKDWASDKYSVYYGSVLTGCSVLSDAEEKGRIERAVYQHGERVPIGGEMEGAGLRKACEQQKKKVPWLVIKGICDWGMQKNIWDELLDTQLKGKTDLNAEQVKNSIQAIATDNAFQTLIRILEHNPQLYQEETFFSVLTSKKRRVTWFEKINVFFLEWKKRLFPSRLLRFIIGVLLIYLSFLFIAFRHFRNVNIISYLAKQDISNPPFVNKLFDFLTRNTNFILFVALLSGLVLVYYSTRIYPFLISKDFAHLQVYLNDELTIQNLSEFSLYQVETSWIKRRSLAPVIEKQQESQIPIVGRKTILTMLERNEIDLLENSSLQFSYLTPENISYFHIFIFLNKKVYSETVFRCKGQKYRLYTKYKHRINDYKIMVSTGAENALS